MGKSLGALQPDHPKTMALQDADLLVCEEFSLMDQLKLSRLTSRMSQATREGAPRKVLLLVSAARPLVLLLVLLLLLLLMLLMLLMPAGTAPASGSCRRVPPTGPT